MKKILFSLLCFFFLTSMGQALDIEGTKIPYYVRETNNRTVYKVSKYYLETPENVVFPKTYRQFASGSNFSESSSYDEYNGNGSVNSIFADASFYGYLENPSDENYFYTQFYIWKYIFNKDIVMCDVSGNLIKEEDIAFFQNLKDKIARHRLEENFFKEPKKGEIWQDTYFYLSNQEKYPFPNVSGLEFEEVLGGFKIINNQVGHYKVNFSLENKEEVKWYQNYDVYTYLRNTGGPSDLGKTIDYTVYGTPFKVEEEITGVNGKYGDALKENNEYALYLDWEEKLKVTPNEVYQIRSNSHYTLKNSTTLEAFKNFEDISFDLHDEETYTLKVKRDIIKAKILLNILDDNTYQIILKSNKEVYKTVNKDTKEVILPYGTYVMEGLDTDYTKEIEVKAEEDISLEINNPHKEDSKESGKGTPSIESSVKEQEKEDDDNLTFGEEVVPDKFLGLEDEVDWSKVPNKDLYLQNNLEFWPPKTNDNILNYVYLLTSSSFLALRSFPKINKLRREGY